MLDLIYCAGKNDTLSGIAWEAGWKLGMRSDASTLDLPQTFIDVEYRNPDFERHIDVVAKYRPKYATVPDLAEDRVDEEDIARAIEQAERLKEYSKIPLIVPKLAEQLRMIPAEYAIGYSVPSSYGGAKFAPLEQDENGEYYLAGRRVHLLGGSPKKQMEIYLYLSNIATVMSADGNYIQRLATKHIKYWHTARPYWRYHELKGTNTKDLYIECFERSCKNLMQSWARIA